MTEKGRVNQRKVTNDKQLQRAAVAMQMLKNMNHDRRGGSLEDVHSQGGAWERETTRGAPGEK